MRLLTGLSRKALLLALALPLAGTPAMADDGLLKSRLDLLRSEFSSGKEAAERPLKTLTDQYRNALTRRMIEAQMEGDQQGLMSAREAAGELDRGIFPPSPSPENAPAAPENEFTKDAKVQELRRLYIIKRQVLAPQAQAGVAPVQRKYIQGLDQLAASLIKAGSTEDAKLVEALKKQTLTGTFPWSEAPGDHFIQAEPGVIAWGDNQHQESTVPPNLDAIAIAAGQGHSLALRRDATVAAWGFNAEGQTTVPKDLSGVTAIAAGSFHNLALKKDGTVAAWGRNVEGQANVPKELTGVTAIAAGRGHSLALKKDGTVIAWGLNDQGQTAVPGNLSGVTAIAAGMHHTLALKQNGTIVAWGSNECGQSDVPKGLSGVTAIATGNTHNLALKKDGTVTAWGYNNHNRSVVPPGLSGITALSAGAHNLALKKDGTVVAWGRNDDGQATVPEGLTGVTAIAAGFYHSLALKTQAP